MSQAILARLGKLENEVKELKQKIKELEPVPFDPTFDQYAEIEAAANSMESVKRRGRPPKHG